jgi:hypothetical protein
MISSKRTITTLIAAAGLATVLAASTVTPSLAATHHTHRARTYDSRAYNAWASAVPRSERRPGAWFAHGAPDDPPGSAFQSYGKDQSIGFVR